MEKRRNSPATWLYNSNHLCPDSLNVITRTSPLGCVIIKMKGWFFFFFFKNVAGWGTKGFLCWMSMWGLWGESPERPSEARWDQHIATGPRKWYVKFTAREVWELWGQPRWQGYSIWKVDCKSMNVLYLAQGLGIQFEPNNLDSNLLCELWQLI